MMRICICIYTFDSFARVCGRQAARRVILPSRLLEPKTIHSIRSRVRAAVKQHNA